MTTMKITTLTFLLIAIGLAGCANEENKTAEAMAEAQKLNAFLAKYEEPSQIFKIPANKPRQVRGKHGTTLFIVPDDLITESGKPLGATIQIELKELINQSQLLKTSAQTVSDGRLLVSGGAYYINMTSGGEQLKLKDDRSLEVKFPKLTNDEMSLFYGSRDSVGIMNWKPAEETFQTSTVPPRTQAKTTKKSESELDAILEFADGDTSQLMTNKEIEEYNRESRLSGRFYKEVSLKSLGWINCDRYFGVPNTTELFVDFNPKDSIYSASTFLLFKDINSVVQGIYYASANNRRAQFFNN